MKRVTKYSILIVLVLFIIASGYLLVTNWILLNPDEKFPYHSDYNEFIIRSDEPVKDNIKQELDSVSWRMASILDYEKNRYQIYLSNNPETYGAFSKKVGKPQKTQGFNIQPLNYSIINVSFVKEMKSRNNVGFRYNILEGNLSHIIAHEICHQLIAEQIGFLKIRKMESWKSEGYCEYSASKRIKENDTTYKFSESVANYFNGRFDDISSGRRFYIESMMVTEYYLDYGNNKFNDLVNDDIKKEIILQEIKSKYREKSL